MADPLYQADSTPSATLHPGQPPGSSALFERHANGITITVPPVGVWRGSKGLFFFAIIWMGFSSLFTVVVVLSGQAPWFVYALMGFFELIGVGILLAAINMGAREAVLAVIGQDLVILYKQVFGKKQHQWPRNGIAQVVAGHSGMEVNHKPVLELQVILQTGEKFGLLAGRDEAELHWMSKVLSEALGAAGGSTLQPPSR